MSLLHLGRIRFKPKLDLHQVQKTLKQSIILDSAPGYEILYVCIFSTLTVKNTSHKYIHSFLKKS